MPKIRKNYFKHTNGYIIVNGHICVAGDDIEVDNTVDCYAENEFDSSSDVFYSDSSPELQQCRAHDFNETKNILKCIREDSTEFEGRLTTESEEQEMENSWTSQSTQFTDTNQSNHATDSAHSCYFSDSETSVAAGSYDNNQTILEGSRKRKFSGSDQREITILNDDPAAKKTNYDFSNAVSFIQQMDFNNSTDMDQFKRIQDIITLRDEEVKKKVEENKQKEEMSHGPINPIWAARQKLQNLLMLVKTLTKMKLIHDLPYLSHMETLLDLSECYQNTYKADENDLSTSLLPPYINNETTLKPLQKNTYNTYDVKIVVDDYFAKKTTRC